MKRLGVMCPVAHGGNSCRRSMDLDREGRDPAYCESIVKCFAGRGQVGTGKMRMAQHATHIIAPTAILS